MAVPLTPLADALALLLERVSPLQDTECVPLLTALGRVLAEPVVSAIDVPPADNSAMDGYALRSVDLQQGGTLTVSQRIAAGEVGETVQAGEAARIFTGAPVPAGADAVVMQEKTEVDGDQLRVLSDVSVGQNIRRRAQDVASGAQVLERGRSLKPQDLGLLASLGCHSVTVFRRLTVAVLSTGDELVEPGAELAEGQIYNSNRYTLIGLLSRLGCDIVDIGIVADDADTTRDALQRAADEADLVLSSGGVSVGEEDHVKNQVEVLGEIQLWKLAIKPGKPLAFGRIGDTPFIGLPGNPSSVFITFLILARPYIRAMQGREEIDTDPVQAQANFSVDRAGIRQEYLRVRVQRAGAVLCAEKFPNQSSGMLSSASWANALAIIPPQQTVAQGDSVDVLLLDSLLGS